MHGKLLGCLFSVALLLLAGCGDDKKSETADTSPDTSDTVSDLPNDSPDGDNDMVAPVDPKICAAVRGNGSRLFAHFGALARIHEHYGTLSGVAGGSSGSITSFLTESMYANTFVWDCDGVPCADDVAAVRLALMLKSMEGYIAVLAGTEEAYAFALLAPLLESALEQGIDVLFDENRLAEASAALDMLLNSPEVADLVNDEVLDLLANSPDAFFHAVEMWEQISTFGSFAVDNDKIFIRPGILDFSKLAEKIGRIGTFYAAYGEADAAAWQLFFDQCAEPGRGLEWAAVAALDAGNGMTCGEHFVAMGSAYRTQLVANEDTAPNRIDDNVGAILPTFIITSVLTGDAVTEFQRARALYTQAMDYGTLDIDFADVQFGYWGQQSDLDMVASNPRGYSDEKTSRFVSLGEAPYSTALSYSPAEPGLARALEIDAQYVSAGGWPDLEPVLALNNMGCDHVILITREGDVRGFGFEVALLFGMDMTIDDALYDLSGDSSSTLSLQEASGVWCTDWDGVDGFDFAAAASDAYNAPLEVHDPVLDSGSSPYGNTSASLGIVGCTPGTAP